MSGARPESSPFPSVPFLPQNTQDLDTSSDFPGGPPIAFPNFGSRAWTGKRRSGEGDSVPLFLLVVVLILSSAISSISPFTMNVS